MHLIFQKIRTGISSMTVKYPKITAFWPFSFIVWFGNIHYDRDSVLVVILGHPMKSINRITFDQPIIFFNKIHIIDMRYFWIFSDCRISSFHSQIFWIDLYIFDFNDIIDEWMTKNILILIQMLILIWFM